MVRTRIGERRNGKTNIEPAFFPRPTHHLDLLLLHPWSMTIEPADEFLLRYVVTYKCRALLDLLTEKDQRVLTFAARRVVQEMPGHEYRLLLSAWRNPGNHRAGDLPRFGGAF
jgi:hypothetical protein